MIGLFDARSRILLITEPLARANKEIAQMVSNIAKSQEYVQDHKGTVDELLKELMKPVCTFVSETLSYPSTVCTHDDCCDLIEVGGQHCLKSKHLCHENCGVQGVKVKTMGDARLSWCRAFERCGKPCIKCGHDWQVHQHQTVLYREKIVEKVDQSVEEKLKSAKTAAEAKENAMEMLQADLQAI